MIKMYFAPLFILCILLMNYSCSKEEVSDSSRLVGSWKLTSYAIDLPLDLNEDGLKSLNLLEELSCESNEILTFDANGLMSATNTFQHEINVSLATPMPKDYDATVICAEGQIGFAAEYSQPNAASVVFNTLEATLEGSALTRTVTSGFNIYNEDFSEVIETKTITLIYTKL